MEISEETRQRILDLPLPPSSATSPPLVVTRFDSELEDQLNELESYCARSVLQIGSLTDRCCAITLRLLKEAGAFRPLSVDTAWKTAKQEYVNNAQFVLGEHFDGSMSLLREKFEQGWRLVRQLIEDHGLAVPPLGVPQPETPAQRLEPHLVHLQYNGSGSGHGLLELGGRYWFMQLQAPFEPIAPDATLLRPEQFNHSDFALNEEAENRKSLRSPVDERLRERDVDLLIDILHYVKPGEYLTAEVAWYRYIAEIHPHGIDELNRSVFCSRLRFTKAWNHMQAALA